MYDIYILRCHMYINMFESDVKNEELLVFRKLNSEDDMASLVQSLKTRSSQAAIPVIGQERILTSSVI